MISLISVFSLYYLSRLKTANHLFRVRVMCYFKLDGEVNVFLFSCCLSRGLREPKITRKDLHLVHNSPMEY